VIARIRNTYDTGTDWFQMRWLRLDHKTYLRWIIMLATGAAFGIAAVVAGIGTEMFPRRYIAILLIGLMVPLAMLVTRWPIRRWLLAILIIEIPLPMDVFLGWEPSVAGAGSIGGFNISLTTFALIGLYSLWILETLVTRRPAKAQPSWYLGLAAVPYVGLVGLSATAAAEPQLAFYEFGLLIQMLFLFIYVAGTVRTREDVMFIMTTLMLVVIVESLYMGYQRFGPNRAFIDSSSGNIYRLRVDGHFGSANVASAYLSLTLMPVLAMLLVDVKRIYKLIATVAFLGGSAALFLTLSRGGWLAFVISVIFFMGFMVQRRWLAISIPLMISVVVGIVVIAFPELVLERLFGDDGGALTGRFPLNDIAIGMAVSNPLLGIGANNFATVVADYTGPEFGVAWIYTVHNKFLLVLSETGPIGLIAFLSFLSILVWRGLRAWTSSNRFYAILALAFTAGLIGHFVHMFGEIFNYRVIVQPLWLHGALLSALAVITCRLPYPKPDEGCPDNTEQHSYSVSAQTTDNIPRENVT
jgi:putative inorganic carbon (hco3(-)) transporter